MNLAEIPAGSIFIYNPIRTLWWCIRNRVWPWPQVYLQALLACIIFLIDGTFNSHVLQYMGSGLNNVHSFIHTRTGKIRKDPSDSFPPGYLETAIIMKPRFPDRFNQSIRDEFENAVDRFNINAWTIPLATLYRWLYRFGFINKDFLKRYTKVNCTAFIALSWLRGGYDIFDNYPTCYVGIHPSDFLYLTDFVKH